MIQDTGMHPGVKGGRRMFPKVNTCGNSSRMKRLARQLVGVERHLAQHPADTMNQHRVAAIQTALRA